MWVVFMADKILDVPNMLQAEAIKVEKAMERIIPKNKRPGAVYELIWDFIDRGGKRFRPGLVLISARAFGATDVDALPAAVAIELFHEFTLVHDDIEDDSEMRRGKPCLHIEYGIPLAINAGDGMLITVWKALEGLKLPPDKQLTVNSMLNDAFEKVLAGQGIELDWRRLNNWEVTEQEYYEMAGGKTGALIAASCAVGAFVGGATPTQVEALRKYGEDVGIAFQIQDDVLNLIGEEEKYKKEIGGDITEGKRSLVITRAFQVLPASEKKVLKDILSSATRDQKKLKKAIAILKDCNAIDYAQTKAFEHVENAKRQLSRIPDSQEKHTLLALADFFVNRQH